MGHNVGVVFDVEVVPEDGGYELRKSGVAGIGGVVEGVLAIAVGIIEADAFRRVAEALGFLQGVKVDDRDLLAHLAGHSVVAGDGDVQIFIGPGLADVGGYEAALVGERDAGGVVGQGLTDDVGDGTVGCCDAADVVGFGYHPGLRFLIIVVAVEFLGLFEDLVRVEVEVGLDLALGLGGFGGGIYMGGNVIGEVVEDFFGDLLDVPFGLGEGAVVIVGAVFQLVVGKGDLLGRSVAEGEQEGIGGGEIGQGEEFQRLQNAHFGGRLALLDGLGDKHSDLSPEDVVAVIGGDLDGGRCWLGECVGLTADNDKALGGFRARGEKFGNGDAECLGDVLQLGDGGVALDAGEEVAGRGAHAVGHIGHGEALPEADFFEVLLYALHIFKFSFCEDMYLLT